MASERCRLLISARPESTREIAPIAPNSLKNRGNGGRNRAQPGGTWAQSEAADPVTGAMGAMGAISRPLSENGKEGPAEPPVLPSQPSGTPPTGVAWRALRERQRRRARDEAIAQWERISPAFARRRAARLAREKAHEAAPADVPGSPKLLGNEGCSDPAHGDDEAGGRT